MATAQNKPRRPSLQINTSQASTSKFTSARKIVMVDPKDPTAFNTLSNVYATVIDRRTPVQPEPVTAINTRQPFQSRTGEAPGSACAGQPRAHTPYALGPAMPDTPLTAHPKSPMNKPEFVFPSAMTATPPLSAGPVENGTPSFTFTPADMGKKLTLNTNIPPAPAQVAPLTPQRSRPVQQGAVTPPSNPPYTHPRTLHSILRNSPLPSSTSRTSSTPRRQSVRLQQRAKRVGYNNPLTQTIVNSKYVFSHVDLLAEDAPPSPMSPAAHDCEMAAERAGDDGGGGNTRDGGMTPGPLEDMRRKMAGLGALNSPGGVKKRRRREKKRQWAWTINTDEDPDDEVGGAIAAIRAAATRAKNASPAEKKAAEEVALLLQPVVYVPDSTPSLCGGDSGAESQDVEMSDESSLVSEDSSRAATPNGMELDERTPLGAKVPGAWPVVFGEGRGRKDTPVPHDLVVA